MRYFTRAKLAAVLTAAAAAAGAGLAVPPAAQAVTPSCGISCVALFSHDFGTFKHPGFVLDVYKQSQKAGQPVILFRGSNSDPAQDWTVSAQGPVSDFYAAGLVSSQLDLHYGCVPSKKHPCTGVNDYAYELEYAPYGADSGLCAGVTAPGGKVTLQPCGVSAGTIWIADTFDARLTTAGVPLITGADTSFSHPSVLTYPSAAYPTDSPRPQLYTAGITGSSNGSGPVLGTVDDNQLWSAVYGPLP